MNKRQPDAMDVLFLNMERIFGRYPVKDNGYEAAENDNQAQQGHDDENE